jgi:hypothetical protein
LVYHLSLENKIVNCSSHVSITGNERVDHLAFSTKYTILISFCKIPASDLLPIHRKILRKNWQAKLSSLRLTMVLDRLFKPYLGVHGSTTWDYLEN